MKSLIVGAYGQDAIILCDLLRLDPKNEIFGIARNNSKYLASYDEVKIIKEPLSESISDILYEYEPDVVYYLAAAHSSSDDCNISSLEDEMYDVNFKTVKIILGIIDKSFKNMRFCFAGSSQMFTKGNKEIYIDESSPFSPRTYYGLTKTLSTNLINFYREEKGLHCNTCIFFNHESIYRKEIFLTRKITKYVAKLKLKIDHGEMLEIKSINAYADWSSAKDVVNGYMQASQNCAQGNFVIASGISTSVKNILDFSFQYVGKKWEDHVVYNDSKVSPALIGNSSKLKKISGWEQKETIYDVLKEMIENDVSEFRNKTNA